MTFEYYKSGKQWRWRLKAGNNEIVATGEAYRNKKDCVKAISLIKSGAADAGIVIVEADDNLDI